MLGFGNLSAAKKKMMRRGFILVGVYYLVFLAGLWWSHTRHPGTAVLVVLATLTAAPIVGVMAAMGRYLQEERDEFHRELVTRCLLWGAGAMMTSVSFHLFLELFGWKGTWSPLIEFFAFISAMLVAKVTYNVANRVPDEASTEAGR